MAKKKTGKVITPSNVRPWPHEERIARILSEHGYIVEFVPAPGVINSADLLIGNVIWEMKSPFTNKDDKLERNIKRATHYQSINIIFDSSRIRKMTDHNVQRFLERKAKEQPQIKRLIFLNKKGQVIDIKGHL